MFDATCIALAGFNHDNLMDRAIQGRPVSDRRSVIGQTEQATQVE